MSERGFGAACHFAEGLFTDLYELTMAQAYQAEAMDQPAVFELFFRKLPKKRNFVVTAGLADVLDYLEHMAFDADDLEYLRSQGQFSEPLLHRLRDFRFTGDVYAVPEGTIVFPNEPVVQVVAPILEAQLLETYVLNQVHFQSVIATKAARVVLAAAGRAIVDFGSRRAHGIDAALKVARASYLAGAAGTSNVLAGKRYGIPLFGTMAHSYIQAHNDELSAFRQFADMYPGTTLLVDAYDTLHGVRNVIALAESLGERFNVATIRLDSGDLADLSFQSRRLLDEAGLKQVTIFASSGLDEYEIERLVHCGAPINGFGVGTKLAVSNDAPELDFAYKLVSYAGEPRTKLSSAKVIYPGRKQVFRRIEDGALRGDVLGMHGEQVHGQALLQPVIRGGKRLQDASPSLQSVRSYASEQIGYLPGSLRELEPAAEPYVVEISRALNQQLQWVQSRWTVPR